MKVWAQQGIGTGFKAKEILIFLYIINSVFFLKGKVMPGDFLISKNFF